MEQTVVAQKRCNRHGKCLSRIKCEKLWQFHGAARADPVIKYALFDAESDLQGAICSSAADFVHREIVISIQNAIIIRIPLHRTGALCSNI